MLRSAILWLHRYVGLLTAGFLIVVGLSGSVIAFNDELNHWLNPAPIVSNTGGELMDPIQLRTIESARIPRGVINAVPLQLHRGEAVSFYVDPKIDPKTQRPFELGFSMVYVDPSTGEELGRDLNGEEVWPITRKTFVPFMNKLHYQLVAGPWGAWILGVVALLWTIDTVLSVYLTFPKFRRRSDLGEVRSRSWIRRWWNPSWLIKWPASGFRLNFDIHRAGGLWLWGLLFVFAWSSVGFNFNNEIYLPTMQALFGMPDVYGSKLPELDSDEMDAPITWSQAQLLGNQLLKTEALRRGFEVVSPDYLMYDPKKKLFTYLVRTSRDIQDTGGTTVLLFNPKGEKQGFFLPSGDNLGSTIHSWIFALHMGKVFGLPYRIFVALFGALIAVLSVTGVYIWLKKLQARKLVQRAPREKELARLG